MKYTEALKICPSIYGLRRDALYILKMRVSRAVELPVQLSHFYRDHIRFKVLSNPTRKGIVETIKNNIRRRRVRRLSRRNVLLNKHFDKEIEYFRLDYSNMGLYTITPIKDTELPKHIATATQHLYKIFE